MLSFRIAKRQCDYLKKKKKNNFRIMMTLNKGILCIFMNSWFHSSRNLNHSSLNVRDFFEATSHKKSIVWLTQ